MSSQRPMNMPPSSINPEVAELKKKLDDSIQAFHAKEHLGTNCVGYKITETTNRIWLRNHWGMVETIGTSRAYLPQDNLEKTDPQLVAISHQPKQVNPALLETVFEPGNSPAETILEALKNFAVCLEWAVKDRIGVYPIEARYNSVHPELWRFELDHLDIWWKRVRKFRGEKDENGNEFNAAIMAQTKYTDNVMLVRVTGSSEEAAMQSLLEYCKQQEKETEPDRAHFSVWT
ncbi:hypothetical protein P280DRAFT_484178 [Massarina eburnea CBS 473.64]|uniref:Uncharacterized protein n=1 Tax=Massarina eburnea CBS 473.64 TaxID=1395130 RepID=A0A6A6RLG5_9PLEO|nr:hypothetical protein P280DRAFT_484178 [Massarina eburnea CBS 473.64]